MVEIVASGGFKVPQAVSALLIEVAKTSQIAGGSFFNDLRIEIEVGDFRCRHFADAEVLQLEGYAGVFAEVEAEFIALCAPSEILLLVVDNHLIGGPLGCFHQHRIDGSAFCRFGAEEQFHGTFSSAGALVVEFHHAKVGVGSG